MKKFYDFQKALEYVVSNLIKISNNSEYSLCLARSKSDIYDYFYILGVDVENSEQYDVVKYLAVEKITKHNTKIKNLSELRQVFKDVIGFDFYSEYVIEHNNFELIEKLVDDVKHYGYGYALREMFINEENVRVVNDRLYLTSEI